MCPTQRFESSGCCPNLLGQYQSSDRLVPRLHCHEQCLSLFARDAIILVLPALGKRHSMLASSRKEIAALWIFSALLFVFVVRHFESFTFKVDNFGDNGAYLDAARAIHTWNFHNVAVKQFWGVSYVVAVLSFLPSLSPRTALLLVCGACSLTTVLLAYRLWGLWIAGYFAIINFDWLQRSFLGGAESLFTALLFVSFICMRSERWIQAAALAAFATVVRPVGFFALVAIGIVLLSRHECRKFLACTAVSVVVGLLYLMPFWLYLHDPFYQLHRYQKADWHAGSAVGLPFQALAGSFLHNTEPLTNVALTLGWIAFVLAGLLAMSRKSLRPYMSEHRAEFLFAFFYVAFLFTYNSGWARAEFPRFTIPVIPFMLKALEPWLPKSRIVLYTVCAVGSTLAAASAVGIRNALAALR
jgi:hypothetical protein